MRREAFTLLETMIVVLIVTAISAIFLPTLAGRAAAGRMSGALGGIESAAALAAAESMGRGAIVALVAEKWEDEWVLWAEEVRPERVGGLLKLREDAPPPAPEADEPRRVELASFSGVDLTDTLPAVPDESVSPQPVGEAAPEDDWGDKAFSWEAERPRLVLSVFFPDGSCRIGPTMYLTGEDGERRVLRLKPLTGRVDARRLPAASEEIEQQGEGDEMSPIPPAEPPDGGDGGRP